ncbi:NACHT, LRR and PYD domains-containing protein 1 [Hondaea fermentalgiana]|uniref:NACHT, LRR and PYD domains-containing protein 1 n=1 Tax=Hondaea fermentalgiana TaxID=2315210 RepID=A0A2R5GMP0_9STRA|nr:NACHT, LRR and PYD domains-containing protein 1 [Hondaea fermentalgiana]|eukprot:GBG31895.1 NACHT, LRR and PYD domains-containing protein 1 [Hondaea fermentalgiana]
MPGAADEFVETYRAACNACGVTAYEEIVEAVQHHGKGLEEKGGEVEEGKGQCASARGLRLALHGNSLKLFSNRIQNTDLQALAAAVKETGILVEELDLRFNQLTGQCAQALVDLVMFGQLQKLVLASNELCAQAIGPLAEVILSGKSSLTHLDLSHNPIGSAGGKALAPCLSSPDCTLLSLHLGSTEQDTDSLVALACALGQNSSLEILNLDNARVFSRDDEITSHIAHVLSQHPTLQDVSLGQQQIRCAGAAILSEALFENDRLRKLRLPGNQISIAGAESLAKLLLSPKCTIELLDLEANPVAKGTEALSDALAYTRTLRVLRLAHCSIVDSSLARLAKRLASNASITELTLWGNHFGPTSSTLFYELYHGRFKHCGVSIDIVPHVASMLPDATEKQKANSQVQIAQRS